MDGVDVNFGCPQRCAEEGGYGCALLEDRLDHACAIVAALARSLRVPVTVQRSGLFL